MSIGSEILTEAHKGTDSNNRALRPKYWINSIWAPKPYSLIPWTLREICSAGRTRTRALLI